MKKSYLVSIILFILICKSAEGANGDFGLGIILGEPTGISGKVWQSDKIAYDGALAWSFGKKGSVHIHADYLWHNYEIIRTMNKYTPVYYGIGARIRSEDKTALGFRFPVGVDFRSRRIPIDIFIEIVPAFNLVPQTQLDFEGGIGVRYYF